MEVTVVQGEGCSRLQEGGLGVVGLAFSKVGIFPRGRELQVCKGGCGVGWVPAMRLLVSSEGAMGPCGNSVS